MTVATKALHAAYHRGGGEMFVAVTRTDSTALVAREVVDDAAATAARQVTSQLPGEDPEHSHAVEFSEYTVVHFGGLSSYSALDAWLTEFDNHFARLGIAAAIAPARPQWNPAWVDQRFATEMGLFAALRLSHSQAEGVWAGWNVSPSDTAHVVAASAAWAYQDAEQAYLRMSDFQARLPRDADSCQAATEALARALPVFPMGGLTGISKTRSSYRSASLSSAGMLVMAYAEPLPWKDKLGQFVDYLRANAELLDVAFLRPTGHRPREWSSSLVTGGPPLPANVGSSPYHRYRLRMREAVLDAHGVQLLTSEHLDRFADLSAWQVEKVTDDRYLVSARDLEEWFGSSRLDDSVLQRARADFGRALTWSF